MKLSRIIPLLGLIHLSALPAAEYILKDLEVLQAEKNYLEFFQHARDIRPSQRDQHWKDMVNFMAENYVLAQIKEKTITPAAFQLVENLFEWPTLQQNEFYLKNREKFGLSYFEKCFPEEIKKGQGREENCYKEMLKFWRRSPQDPYLGLNLAKLAKAHAGKSHRELWVFLQMGVLHDLSHFICQDPLVKETLFHFFTYHLIKMENQGPKFRQLLSATLSSDCWAQFKTDLETALLSSRGHIQTNAYLILKAKNDLNPLNRDFYLTLYLLQGPVAGDLFNESWNNLKDMGKNFNRRMEVFGLLKKLDPLPGKVFSLYDQQKKSVILDYFSRNFPEYMDFYARTCLDYLSGKKNFENGNPTLFCKDLMDSAKNTTWVEPQLQQSLLQTKRF